MVDLLAIEGDGDFPCPNCSVTISPEDESEKVYTLKEVKLKKESIELLILECNNCESEIHLVGFSLKLITPNVISP
jgi:hypothetical protein